MPTQAGLQPAWVCAGAIKDNVEQERSPDNRSRPCQSSRAAGVHWPSWHGPLPAAGHVKSAAPHHTCAGKLGPGGSRGCHGLAARPRAGKDKLVMCCHGHILPHTASDALCAAWQERMSRSSSLAAETWAAGLSGLQSSHACSTAPKLSARAMLQLSQKY